MRMRPLKTVTACHLRLTAIEKRCIPDGELACGESPKGSRTMLTLARPIIRLA